MKRTEIIAAPSSPADAKRAHLHRVLATEAKRAPQFPAKPSDCWGLNCYTSVVTGTEPAINGLTRRNRRGRVLMLVKALVPTGDRSWPHQHSGERILAASASAPELQRRASDNKIS